MGPNSKNQTITQNRLSPTIQRPTTHLRD